MWIALQHLLKARSSPQQKKHTRKPQQEECRVWETRRTGPWETSMTEVCSFTEQHLWDTAHQRVLLPTLQVKTSVSDVTCLHGIIRAVNNDCHCRNWSSVLSNYLTYFSLARFCIIRIITGMKFKPVVHNKLISTLLFWVSLDCQGGLRSPLFFLRKEALSKTRLITLSSARLQRGFLLRNHRVGSPILLFPSSFRKKAKPHNGCPYLHFRVLFMPDMPVWMYQTQVKQE